MELQTVDSSLINAVGYNVDHAVLHIRFNGKADVYEYQNISPERYEEMMASESIGKYFLNTIKPFKDRHPYRKLEAATESTDFTASGTPLPVAVPAQPEIIIPSDPEALKSAALALNEKAKAIEIKTPEAYELAATTLLAIARMRAGLESTFRPDIQEKHAAWKASLAVLNHYDNPLEEDEKRLKAGMSTFNREQERIRREHEEALRIQQQRIAEEEAAKAAQELQLADAIQAEQGGETELAEQILSAPALPVSVSYMPPVRVASVVPKVKGIAHKEDWDFEIVDASRIPRQYMIPDEKAIRAHAKSMKSRASIDGIRFFDKGGVSASRRA